MPSFELTPKETFITELALRIVLCELLEKEQQMIHDVTAVAHNLKVGCFGNKEWKPENPNDWIQYLQPMRDLLAKLDPRYAQHLIDMKSQPYILPEEHPTKDYCTTEEGK